jgi:hypothetical protein
MKANPEEGTGEFSVWIFYKDGYHFSDWRWLDGEKALLKAQELTRRPVMLLGMVERIIITDGEDFTVFEWKPKQGVTFPKSEVT